MYHVEVYGEKRVAAKLELLARQIKRISWQEIESFGNNLVQRLSKEFNQFIWKGIPHAQAQEYWIVANKNFENSVICKLTGKSVDVKTEKEVGRERGQQTTPWKKEINVKQIADRYGKEVALSIERAIKEFI